MVHYKDTCDLRLMLSQTLFAIFVADQVAMELGYKETWLTSVSDDAPGRLPNSLHKSGLAFDMKRPSTLSVKNEAFIANKIYADMLRVRLGPQYDVVFEEDHIHVEFQPKAWASDLKRM